MDKEKVLQRFARLIEIVKKLRGPGGCKWDRAQTHKSLVPYMTEELYEVIEAIEEDDMRKLKEELGDLLLHVVFQADLAEEEGHFTLADSIETISSKLVRRHPHVFAGLKVGSVSEIKKNWEEIKLREGRQSLLEGIPKNLPALLLARRVQQRASEVGFDWERVPSVIEKLEEEFLELKNAIESREQSRIRDELGDLLFTVVNLSRFLDIDPEDALRHTIKKFINRFKLVEEELRKKGKKLEEATLSEMDRLWNEIKRNKN
ncbi:MAG: nucleoside triphosphate pyrophosphohydrolase [Candidatus Marinimicrobia bacterium]|nr:nucleoside triphosphate pyrophosphohydrolase [Candidatus Neomarinimicrobiota bacterium]HDN58959.1 nucleoside triphosphate pyrophosphohydrolase [Candidatus Neomarinimicrobiota bacterium]